MVLQELYDGVTRSNVGRALQYSVFFAVRKFAENHDAFLLKLAGGYHEVAAQKQLALDTRYALNPERFVRGRPTIKLPPEQVLINPVTAEQIEEGVSTAVNFPTLNRVKDKSTLSFN